MTHADGHGHGQIGENGTEQLDEFALDFEPESPFLMTAAEETESPAVSEEATTSWLDHESLESPFLAAHSFEESHGLEDESQRIYFELVNSLRDEEFTESLVDLVNELRSAEEERFSSEHGDPTALREEAERSMTAQLAPLERELESTLENLAQAADVNDLGRMDELELDAFLDRFEPSVSFEQPVMEDFFKKIFRKIKKGVKSAVRFVKKGVKKAIKFAGKLLPFGFIFRKLRKLVRPLLRRVIKFGLNRLPARYRSLARRVARRLLRETLGEQESMEELEEQFIIEMEDQGGHRFSAVEDDRAAAPVAEVIEAEFDTLLAGYLLEGEQFDAHPMVSEYLSDESSTGDGLADLDRAREQFVTAISELEEGEDPTPHVEHFATAILAAVRIGIRIIGRGRVVRFLARLVARLIRRFVGKKAARPLSRALVDAGLKMLSLERPDASEEEDDPRAAAETLAATVEETFERLIAEAPESAFEDETLLEVYVREAFDEAAAANFPAEMVRPALREGETSRGVWSLMPRGHRRKRYKKYSRVIGVTITPRMAASIRTFGGRTLRSFLRDQLGQPIDTRKVEARLHLYEAIRGSTLSHIAYHEKSVPGLGSGRRHAWMQLHPLTTSAATALLGPEGSFGRAVPSRFLQDRNAIAVGQRFYYLEIRGARITVPPARTAGRPARQDEVNVTIHRRSGKVVIAQFLGESRAQAVASKLRSGESVSASLVALNAGLSSAIRAVMSGGVSRHVRIVSETAPEGFLPALAGRRILRFLGVQLAKYLLGKVAAYLRARFQEFKRDFIAAADSPADGVTVLYTVQVADLAHLTSPTASALDRARAMWRISRRGLSGALSLDVRPGFRRS